MNGPGRGELVDRFGRRVPALPVVDLHVDRTAGRVPLRVDGVAVDVPRGDDPHRAGLATAAGRARDLGRPVRVRLAGPWSEWPLVVHGDGSVDDARDPVSRPAALSGARGRPRRRPVGVLAATAVVAVAVLVGGVGTGVATLGARGAAPAECRPVTLFAVGGSVDDAAQTISGVTDPLVATRGDELAVVSVPPPASGASYDTAQPEAVTALATGVRDQLAACPSGVALLIGHSEGAHVAGDLAARVGAGQERGIAPERILAVGLFGDPARDPRTRAVPEGVAGQGVLPRRASGFGALEARTIEICAPGDPVCDTPSGATPPPLEEALTDPARPGYAQLPVATGTTATSWASESLGRLVASLPAEGAAPTTTTAAPGGTTTRDAPADAASTTTPPAGTTTPPAGAANTTTPPGGAAGTTTPVADGAAADGEGDGGYGPTTTGPTSTGPTIADPTDDPAVADPTTTTAAERTGRDRGSTVETTRPAEDEGGATRTGAPGSTPSGGAETGALWALMSGLEGFRDSHGGNVEGGGLAPEAVESPNVPGREVVKLEVPAGGKRSEVRPEEAQDIREGQHLFFGYSAFLPPDFPVDAESWQVVWQLHDGGTNTSPPVALEIVDGRLWLANVGDRVRDLGPVRAGQNLDVQLDITFEIGGGDVTVYRGGRPVLENFAPPQGTMIDSFDYLKTGVYRDQDNGGGGATLFLNDLKIGETLGSVSQLAGAEGGAGPTGG